MFCHTRNVCDSAVCDELQAVRIRFNILNIRVVYRLPDQGRYINFKFKVLFQISKKFFKIFIYKCSKIVFYNYEVLGK